jgi:hypothetical protein
MTRPSSSALAEIRENEAPPETAGLYDDIRRETGLPVVNLIYRHFATLPGVLPWVWGLLRPALRSGQVDEALQRIGATLRLPTPRGLSAALSGLDDLGDADRQDIAAILDVYNRGNLLNLINLNAVRIVLDRRDPGDAAAPSGQRVERMERVCRGPTPPLPKLAELSDEVGSLVRSLAALHSAGDGVIPSLYLHLAYWPPLLAAARAPIGELIAGGELEWVRSDLQRLAVAEARGLAQAMTPDRPAPAEHVEPLRRALEIFAGRLIGEMAVIGRVLRQALPPDAPSMSRRLP